MRERLSDWLAMSQEQRIEVDSMRDKVLSYLIMETEALYKRHPELQVHWHFGLDATLRELDELRAQLKDKILNRPHNPDLDITIREK